MSSNGKETPTPGTSDRDSNKDTRNFLEFASTTGGKGSSPVPLVLQRPPPEITALPPPTALLNRLSNFLPQIQKANKDLEQRVSAGESVDLEALSDSEDAHIEMDLDLGVFDVKLGNEPQKERPITLSNTTDSPGTVVIEEILPGLSPDSSTSLRKS